MPDSVKAIHCPQCGSTKYQLIGEDKYCCKSCGTTYFFDEEDKAAKPVAQNPAYAITPVDRTGFTFKWYYYLIALPFIGYFLFALILGVVSATGSSSGSPSKPIDQHYISLGENNFVVNNPVTHQPVVISIENREYNSDDKKNGIYVAFYNPQTGRQLKVVKMEKATTPIHDFYFKTFRNGKNYLIVDKAIVYEINLPEFTLIKCNDKISQSNEALVSGIATIQFLYPENGDGFKITSNEGKKYFYYPEIRLLCTRKEAMAGFPEESKRLLAKAQSEEYYTFSSSYNPEEEGTLPSKLLKVTYKTYPGIPQIKYFRPLFRKMSGGYYSSYDRKIYHIRSIKELTPDRNYYSPFVLLEDKRHLIIAFKTDVNPATQYILQSLNPMTGKIKWSYPGLEYVSDDLPCVVTQNGIILKKGNKDAYIAVDSNGKKQYEFKVPD